MGCNCGKNKSTVVQWEVNFNGTLFRFEDGAQGVKKFSSVGEANQAIKLAGASGRVQPKPSR